MRTFFKRMDILRNVEGRVGVPLLLWFLGVPGGVCIDAKSDQENWRAVSPPISQKRTLPTSVYTRPFRKNLKQNTGLLDHPNLAWLKA